MARVRVLCLLVLVDRSIGRQLLGTGNARCANDQDCDQGGGQEKGGDGSQTLYLASGIEDS